MSPAGEQLPLVSVIMNGLNCERYVREAIDSVYAQTYPRWEIVFWDNASTDGTARIVSSYDDRTRYFRAESTTPLGQARNLAVAQARGELIAFLDTDDLWLPDKLALQVPLFRHENVGLVYSDTILFSEDGRESRLYGYLTPRRGRVFRNLLADYFLSLVTVMVRASALQRLNPCFHPEFNVIEEADLFRRIAYRWDVDFVDRPLARYRRHAGNLSQQLRDAWPSETERMLEMFAEMFPDFETEYAPEIRLLRAHVAYNRARHCLRVGDAAGTRRLLRPFVFLRLRYGGIFALSLLPHRVNSALVKAFSLRRVT